MWGLKCTFHGYDASFRWILNGMMCIFMAYATLQGCTESYGPLIRCIFHISVICCIILVTRSTFQGYFQWLNGAIHRLGYTYIKGIDCTFMAYMTHFKCIQHCRFYLFKVYIKILVEFCVLPVLQSFVISIQVFVQINDEVSLLLRVILKL